MKSNYLLPGKEIGNDIRGQRCNVDECRGHHLCVRMRGKLNIKRGYDLFLGCTLYRGGRAVWDSFLIGRRKIKAVRGLYKMKPTATTTTTTTTTTTANDCNGR